MSVEILDFFDRLPSDWVTRSDAQRLALACPSELLNFGGAAGSLKSETTLVDALKYIDNPEYRAVIFRKTYPELEFLIDRTRVLYGNSGGRIYEGNKPEWRWPWGSVIEFRHMDKPKDVYKHQGPAYQYVAFDESTHQPEFVLRFIFNSRMRSKSGIPLRMRLPTNPGNIGHGYHKAIFQGPKCLHCIEKAARESGTEPKYLKTSRRAGVIYNDARWPSDGELIGATTCFIPGRVRDHTLFGVGGGDYADKRLKGLPRALREAMLEGCWEEFEGQYFDCFDVQEHVVLRDQVIDKPWWPYWVSIDYGFSQAGKGHACVAYLWTMDSDNHVYTIGEYYVHRRKAVDVAADLQTIWGDKNIKAWYLGRDSFKHDGRSDDFSMAEEMSIKTGIYFDQAYTDRASGALLMYTLLSENRWSICGDQCPLLVEALPTCVHDEKEPEKVAKDVTKDEDDAFDAARYGIASHISPGRKPEAEILADKFKNEFDPDPTIAMIQLAQYRAQQEQLNAPMNYRTRSRA